MKSADASLFSTIEYSYAEIFALLKEKGFIIYELEQFRYLDVPRLRLLTNKEIDTFSDYSTWTKEDIGSERMVYACKNPV